MGTTKQVNFYLSNTDQQNLTRSLEAYEGIMAAVIPAASPIIRPVAISTVSEWHPGEHYAMLFLTQDAPNIKLTPSPNGGYLADVENDPIVEFRRCSMRNDLIVRGRFYFSTASYIANRPVKKNSAFLSFANWILRRTKSLLSLRDGIYLGSEAIELERRGMRFYQG